MNDFLIDFSAGSICKNGDLFTGESDDQNKRILIVTEKGSFKEFPATGVGAATFLENEDQAGLYREVRTQFIADGMTVNRLVIEDGKLKVDANY
jgi:hypothetical protein